MYRFRALLVRLGSSNGRIRIDTVRPRTQNNNNLGGGLVGPRGIMHQSASTALCKPVCCASPPTRPLPSFGYSFCVLGRTLLCATRLLWRRPPGNHCGMDPSSSGRTMRALYLLAWRMWAQMLRVELCIVFLGFFRVLNLSSDLHVYREPSPPCLRTPIQNSSSSAFSRGTPIYLYSPSVQICTQATHASRIGTVSVLQNIMLSLAREAGNLANAATLPLLTLLA
jgi:hypothetical protein